MTLRIRFEKIGDFVKTISIPFSFIEDSPGVVDWAVIMKRDGDKLSFHFQDVVKFELPDFIFKKINGKVETYSKEKKTKEFHSLGEFRYKEFYGDGSNVCYRLYWSLP